MHHKFIFICIKNAISDFAVEILTWNKNPKLKYKTFIWKYIFLILFITSLYFVLYKSVYLLSIKMTNSIYKYMYIFSI